MLLPGREGAGVVGLEEAQRILDRAARRLLDEHLRAQLGFGTARPARKPPA